jgi:type II secretory pathway predicted ATPase ExeA
MVLPEYLKYWGFQKSPFSLSPDPTMLFLSQQHQEALLRLKYGVLSNKGGVLLISENAGDGKTSILRRLMDDLRSEYNGRIKIAFLDHPTFTVNQMVAEIARQLGVARVRKDKIDNLNALRTRLEALHDGGHKALVVVDEGQMLAHNPEALQELRILLNFCVSDAFLMSFVLSGQKPLEDALKKMPEFWQRLPVRFFLRNLDQRDTGEMLRYRVRAAGQLERDIFTPTAAEGIFRFSQGCPRVICSIADLALLVGHSLSSHKVDFREVAQATTDMNRSGDVFHYMSFLGSERAARRKRAQCKACRRFLKANATSCGRCGAVVVAESSMPLASDKPVEEKVLCPSCRSASSPSGRCSCGFVLTQSCVRCQNRNPADATACVRCGTRLAGRESIAARDFEEGLRKLGVNGIDPATFRRFPMLQAEGRIYWAWVKPRFWPWGPKAALHTREGSACSSVFFTDRGVVLVGDSKSRRIQYDEIRGLVATPGERQGEMAMPRLRLNLDGEEVRLELPVKTDRPAQFVALLSEFVTNKRLLPPPAARPARQAVERS